MTWRQAGFATSSWQEPSPSGGSGQKVSADHKCVRDHHGSLEAGRSWIAPWVDSASVDKKSWEESCGVPGLVLRMHGLQFILYSFCLGTLDHELFMRFCVIYPPENTPSRQKKVGMVGLVEHVRYRRPTADLSLGWSPKSQESWLCLQNGGWLTWYDWLTLETMFPAELYFEACCNMHVFFLLFFS